MKKIKLFIGMTHVRPDAKHIYVSRASNQTTNLTNDDPVEWDTIITSRGNEISLDAVTNIGRFTLEAGYRYKLQAQVRNTYTDSSGAGRYNWYDVTNSTIFGKAMQGNTNPPPTPESEPSTACAIIKPTTNIEVEVRRITGNNIQSIDYLYTWAIIEIY